MYVNKKKPPWNQSSHLFPPKPRKRDLPDPELQQFGRAHWRRSSSAHGATAASFPREPGASSSRLNPNFSHQFQNPIQIPHNYNNLQHALHEKETVYSTPIPKLCSQRDDASAGFRAQSSRY